MTPDAAAVPRSTILVVEPDILVRMSIAEFLRECGYRVLEAATAEDVATVLNSEQPVDVVFAEVRLTGGRDGFELARWVRQNHPGVDVVLTSGVAGAADKALDLCEDGPLPKPYHPQEVVRRINLLIERRRDADARSDSLAATLASKPGDGNKFY